MAHMTSQEVDAWLEPTKLSVNDVEDSLEGQVSNLVFGRLAGTFNVATWTTQATTPQLIRTIIAMHYAAWIIDRAFSDSSNELNQYAILLRQMADVNIEGLISGALEFSDIIPIDGADASIPLFFPNDASSALEPTVDFPSNGPPKFLMGQVF